MAQDRPHIFVGATIIPIEGDDIESGALVVRAGKIEAIGLSGAPTTYDELEATLPDIPDDQNAALVVRLAGLVEVKLRLITLLRPDMRSLLLHGPEQRPLRLQGQLEGSLEATVAKQLPCPFLLIPGSVDQHLRLILHTGSYSSLRAYNGSAQL